MLCYYAECRILFTIMLSIIMPSVVMLNVEMLSVEAPFESSLLFTSKAGAYPGVALFRFYRLE